MSVLGNAKSNRHRKTYPVEPGGTGRKYLFLLGETWRVRASQESAEAIVALMPGESWAERRAEESREDHSLHPFPAARRRATRVRSGNCGSSRTGRAKPSRWIPAEGRRVPIESRRTASTDVRRGSMSNTVDIRIHSTVGARGLSPLDSTAGCGKPHVRWCGRADGRNPVSPTRSVGDMTGMAGHARPILIRRNRCPPLSWLLHRPNPPGISLRPHTDGTWGSVPNVDMDINKMLTIH
jgi:hypothetical protein